MMQLSDVAVSVETETMHLANAVGIPLVALMRHRTREWAPLDKQNSVVVRPRHQGRPVRDIQVEEVYEALRGMIR